MSLKKEHLNIIIRIIGSLQAYIFAAYAGFLKRRAFDISLYSNITDELIKEQQHLGYLSLAYTVLFFFTIFGILKIEKWSIIVSLILGAIVFLFSIEFIL
jgi:hypothetical protein